MSKLFFLSTWKALTTFLFPGYTEKPTFHRTFARDYSIQHLVHAQNLQNSTTASLLIPTISPVIRMLERQSLWTISLIPLIFSSVTTDIDGPCSAFIIFQLINFAKIFELHRHSILSLQTFSLRSISVEIAD